MNKAPGQYKAPQTACLMIKLMARKRMTCVELARACRINETAAQKWLTVWQEEGLINGEKRKVDGPAPGPKPEEFWLSTGWRDLWGAE